MITMKDTEKTVLINPPFIICGPTLTSLNYRIGRIAKCPPFALPVFTYLLLPSPAKLRDSVANPSETKVMEIVCDEA